MGATNGVAGAYAGVFYGPVVVGGDFTVFGAKSAAVPHPDGSHRRLYCMESPESWFEDFGKGTLECGQADVTIDPDFAAVVDMDDYHVFLTQYGGHDDLSVTAQTPLGLPRGGEGRHQRGPLLAGASWRSGRTLSASGWRRSRSRLNRNCRPCRVRTKHTCRQTSARGWSGSSVLSEDQRMTDDAFTAPGRVIPPRVPRPGELLVRVRTCVLRRPGRRADRSPQLRSAQAAGINST